MAVDNIAFHEVFVLGEFLTHESNVRNTEGWHVIEADDRWHTVRITFDTYADLARVWVDPVNGGAPQLTVPYNKSKSELRAMSMEQVLDWLLT